MTEVDISQTLAASRSRLERALHSAGRPSSAAALLAVSKTKPASMMREAYHHGQRDFGENYLQEALDKQEALSDLDQLVWHFIGPLQSNKTRRIAERFDWVHSLDRLKTARRLSEHRPADMPPLNVCIQVNVSDESSKSGVPLSELDALVADIMVLPGLRLRGLMAIPYPTDDIAKQRQPFALLRQALESLAARYPQAALDTLSMGMSGDLEAAISEGATWVRLGTAIFGERPKPSVEIA
ncbi:YggS family pyridoxal phosphate-dependent enzyme [Aidingimonas lacisalsi]|uniref:YggS family pyridoxal phosphate-dependent enzyme n=1 Tax=Aidingimonas lacisalsi TaxID=2604086 RepID=UPI0011D1CFB8|nr:YggS family pyridoxal phosphate-dependent enzyme [Aidingimonas lacisalsi]